MGHARLTALLMFVIALAPPVFADDAHRDAMLSLDEQVQDVKADVIAISSELALLEEQLLFPSNTQLAIFMSMAEQDPPRMDAVAIAIDGEAATRHIYSFQELEALQKGGVQRLFMGNIARGEHALEVSVMGKTPDGKDFNRTQTFTFTKGIEPSLLGLTLMGPESGRSLELAHW